MHKPEWWVSLTLQELIPPPYPMSQKTKQIRKKKKKPHTKKPTTLNVSEEELGYAELGTREEGEVPVCGGALLAGEETETLRGQQQISVESWGWEEVALPRELGT